MTAARLILPELLDDAPPADALPSLRDLTRINRFLGGYATLRWLLANTPGMSDSSGFSLLDVGAASGDMGQRIRQARPHARVTSFDYRPHHLAAAQAPKVVGDAFQLPFSPRSFDYVFSSLFLHHFDADAVTALLSGFARLARRAVLAIDLDRGPLAFHFIPATRWLFGWHPITLHDAPLSVQAAFKAGELAALAQRAGMKNAQVRTHRPWSRLSLIAPAG